MSGIQKVLGLSELTGFFDPDRHYLGVKKDAAPVSDQIEWANGVLGPIVLKLDIESDLMADAQAQRRVEFDCGRLHGGFWIKEGTKASDLPEDTRRRALVLFDILLKRGAARSFLLGKYGPLFLCALAEHPEIRRSGPKVLLLPQFAGSGGRWDKSEAVDEASLINDVRETLLLQQP